MATTHEVQVDTKLAELWSEANSLRSKLEQNKLSLAHSAGIRPTYVTRNRREVRETADEIIEILTAKLDTLMPYEQRNVEEKIEDRKQLQAQLEQNKAEAHPLEVEYDNNGWSRFFLVNNANGHIHSSMHCSTCNFRTSFSWLPTLSGLTEKDAVDAHGPHLCTVCFPSAPVEWTMGEEKPVDPDQCPGSGTHDHDSSGLRYYSPRAKCNHCGQTQSVTSTGKLRKHKSA